MITGGAAPDQLNARPARLHPRPASLLFDLQQLQTPWKHTHTQMRPIVWNSGAQASGERIEIETKSSPFPTVQPWSCLSCLSERSHTALRWLRGPGSIRIPAGRSLKRADSCRTPTLIQREECAGLITRRTPRSYAHRDAIWPQTSVRWWN